MTSVLTRRHMILSSSAAALTLAACRARSSGRPRIGLLYFAPEQGAEVCMKGIFDGLAAQGFHKDQNLDVLSAHANAEISQIPMLVQNFVTSGVDLIFTMTTPCLTAACTAARNSKIVFTYCYDPVAAGAGTSFTSHLPNVTGVGSFPPVDATVDLIQKLVPGVKSVGTVYNSSEVNSVKVITVARDAFKKRGIALQEVTATNTSEVFQAAQVACYRGVQAIWVTGDNTALQSFDGIVKATTDARLPLIINDPEFTARGALACCGLGWYAPGKAGGELAARVLRGEDPSQIPFQEIAEQKLVLNQQAATRLGIVFPADLQAAAKA
ncbi:MAG TPA: ABC transporter substrate-binding protein [Terracidiphilus sp.]|jgi:putative ABC transport system substrate-binding protein|nr:ABC transporter substrate-binding protein [Terracidiphilus sp.]